MDFKLTIHCDNAAFEDKENEVAWILKKVIAKLERGEDFSHYITLMDSNGNDVGRAAFKEAK